MRLRGSCSTSYPPVSRRSAPTAGSRRATNKPCSARSARRSARSRHPRRRRTRPRPSASCASPESTSPAARSAARDIWSASANSIVPATAPHEPTRYIHVRPSSTRPARTRRRSHAPPPQNGRNSHVFNTFRHAQMHTEAYFAMPGDAHAKPERITGRLSNPIALSLRPARFRSTAFYPPCGKKPLVTKPRPTYTCRTRDKTLFVG